VSVGGNAAAPGLGITVRSAQAQSGLVPVDARALLAHVLGADRAWLAAHADDVLDAAHAAAFFALARLRREGEPVAYLTGRREFWGLDLSVTPAVLIPRPETEALVEIALALLSAERPTRVLDIGTGCGAVALALARERPRARVLATDVSRNALGVARQNAARLCIANVDLLQSDLWDSLPAPDADLHGHPPGPPYDLIVSNPPYVASADPHLGQGDLRFEPLSALVSGRDGLDLLRAIIAGAPAHLARGGHLAVEHGHDQADAVRDLFASAGFVEIMSARDLAGIPRVCAGRRG
jgi:release factor glutamine methyltransferase